MACTIIHDVAGGGVSTALHNAPETERYPFDAILEVLGSHNLFACVSFTEGGEDNEGNEGDEGYEDDDFDTANEGDKDNGDDDSDEPADAGDEDDE